MLHSSELVRRFQVCNSTPLNSEKPASQSSIAALPVVTYQAGETVIVDGSRTAWLLILKKGAVVILFRVFTGGSKVKP